jgi:hypothetical protein
LNRTEQNRTEQNRTEQNRTEQNRTEQNRTEQYLAGGGCLESTTVGLEVGSGVGVEGVDVKRSTIAISR